MIDLDNLREIWGTMKKNKLRTFLTGFSVAWGIFMLIVLLGIGNGLGNGIAYNFSDMATNSLTCWGRYTVLPYKGMRTNRNITLNMKDLQAIPGEHPEVGILSPVNFRGDTIASGTEYLAADIQAVYPEFASIVFVPIPAGNGRFINEMDLERKRKVIVLSPRMAEILFRRSGKAIGSNVKVGNVPFKVVGIYKDDNRSNNAPAYIPFTTGQLLYNDLRKVDMVKFTLNGVDTEAKSRAFETRLRKSIAARHHFDPADNNALALWSTDGEFRMWQGLTNGITLFIWIIGLGTLTAGIVGVSNIMLISVRERTREFGIRKAIGAKPSSILLLVIFESILVTALFGYIGMISGIGLTEGINHYLQAGGSTQAGINPGDQTSVFRNPTVGLGISLAATGVLIIAGVLAGYFPARKAVKVPAIEAIRVE